MIVKYPGSWRSNFSQSVNGIIDLFPYFIGFPEGGEHLKVKGVL